jgi:hypothetical protein
LFAAGVIDDDCRTIGGQTFGDRPTDAARSSGNKRCFSLEWQRHVSSLLKLRDDSTDAVVFDYQ